MKIAAILSLFLFALPAFGELTKEDVRTIVKEEITASEKRMKDHIDLKLDLKLQATNTRIDGLDKRVENIWILMLTLISLMAVFVIIPKIVVGLKDRSENSVKAEIKQLRKIIEDSENIPS